MSRRHVVGGWGHSITPTPWPELADRYGALDPSLFAHLRAIVDSVVASTARDALFATTSLHDLVVTDHIGTGNPAVVVVRSPVSMHPPAPGVVRIEHLASTGRNDSVERPCSESVPLFWRFVQEKFGVQVPTRHGVDPVRSIRDRGSD